MPVTMIVFQVVGGARGVLFAEERDGDAVPTKVERVLFMGSGPP